MAVIHGMPWLNQFLFSYNQQDLEKKVEYSHAHEGLEFLYIHVGSGRLILNNQLYEIEAPTLMIFQPFQHHLLNMDHPYSRSLLKIKLPFDHHFAQMYPYLHNFVNQLTDNKIVDQVHRLNEKHDTELHQLFRLFNETYQHLSPPEQKEHLYYFIAQCLAYYKTRIHSGPVSSAIKLDPRAVNHVEKVINWIESNYMHKFQLKQLAAEVHLSPGYLSRLFHRYAGNTILEYIRRRRLEVASTLLKTTSMSVNQIASATGFADDSYFCRCFKKKYGLTPMQYREFRH